MALFAIFYDSGTGNQEIFKSTVTWGARFI